MGEGVGVGVAVGVGVGVGVAVGVTVTIIVTVAVPRTLPLDAVIVVVPAARAVNKPALLIVPTLGLLLLHVMSAVIGFPFWSFVEAVKVLVLSDVSETEDGDTVMEVNIGAGVGVGVGVTIAATVELTEIV